MALISDNYAVELMPTSFAPGDCVMLPLHHHCLFKTGVNLGEIWRLSELADWLRANNRSRFLLTGPAAAAARRRGLARHAGCDGVTAAVRKQRLPRQVRWLLNRANRQNGPA